MLAAAAGRHDRPPEIEPAWRRAYDSFMARATPNSRGLLLLVVLAALGVLLVYLPSRIVENYRAVTGLGPDWGRVYLAVVGTGGALLAGCSLWITWRMWRRSVLKRRRVERQQRNPSELTAAEKEREVAEHLADVERLRADPQVTDEVRQELAPRVREIEQKQESQRLEIVAFGTISSGKSSLLNTLAGRDVFAADARGGTTLRRAEVPWPGDDRVTLVDTPGLGEVEGADRQRTAAEAARDADLVLLVLDGPLRESEFQLLQTLAGMEKRVLVCLTKEDWYEADDRAALLGQIARQVQGFVDPRDVVAVRARPLERTRVRALADGTQTEELIAVPADIQPLAEQMMRIVRRDGRDLLLANLLLQSRGLVEQARERVRETLDRRAWEVVERHMWGAGGAAALSPLPLVDLAAGCAISTRMVLELGRVYHQDMDLDVAVNLLAQQGKNLLAVLGTTAATPAVAAVVASLLKTVPGIGTITGGLLQGIVQALVTRWIGAIFIEYFRHEMQTPPGGMTALARREWERMTSVAELRRLVLAARKHLRSAANEDQVDS